MLVLIIARLSANVLDSNLESLSPIDAEKVREYYAFGKIRTVYYFEDRRGAAMIYEGENLQEAEAAAATLPLATTDGSLSFELIPLKPHTNLQKIFFSGAA